MSNFNTGGVLYVSVPLTESCHLVNIMLYENVVKNKITPKNGDAVRYVCIRVVFVAPSTSWGYTWLSHARPDGGVLPADFVGGEFVMAEIYKAV